MSARTLLVLLLAALLLPLSGRALACDDQLPEELRALRKQAGCRAIGDFFERPGMVEAPYLYGYLPGNKEDSAAFWCYQPGGEEPYVLVLVQGDRIASTVRQRNYPGGLSLHDSAHVALSEFRYVDNPQEHGPKARTTSHPPLRSEYDGNITLYYRDGERWLFELYE